MELIDILLVDPQNGFKTFCRRVLLNHAETLNQPVLTDEPNGDPVEGTAESCRDVEPAPVPTDEPNGDPVEGTAESSRDVEPAPVPTDEPNGDPVEGTYDRCIGLCLVDESTEDPTSFLFDYSLPTGDQICDQTSAENSHSDEDDTLSDTGDCDEDSQETGPEKIVKPTTNPRPRSDARYSLRRRVQPPPRLCVNLCPSSGRASPKGRSDVTE